MRRAEEPRRRGGGRTPAASPVPTTQTSPRPINKTICVPGWIKTVRPPVSYTTPLKAKQVGEYGYKDTSTADYEEGQLIPLELGGALRDPKNLWPEPRYGNQPAASKGSVEGKHKTAVCNGTVKLDAARKAIATGWTTALSQTGLS